MGKNGGGPSGPAKRPGNGPRQGGGGRAFHRGQRPDDGQCGGHRASRAANARENPQEHRDHPPAQGRRHRGF